jgi:hypothetical protein
MNVKRIAATAAVPVFVVAFSAFAVLAPWWLVGSVVALWITLCFMWAIWTNPKWERDE